MSGLQLQIISKCLVYKTPEIWIWSLVGSKTHWYLPYSKLRQGKGWIVSRLRSWNHQIFGLFHHQWSKYQLFDELTIIPRTYTVYSEDGDLTLNIIISKQWILDFRQSAGQQMMLMLALKVGWNSLPDFIMFRADSFQIRVPSQRSQACIWCLHACKNDLMLKDWG